MCMFLDVMIVTTKIKNQSGLSPTQSAGNSQNVDTPSHKVLSIAMYSIKLLYCSKSGFLNP